MCVWDVIDEVIATDVFRTFMQQGSTAALPSPVTCCRVRRKGHLAAQCFATLRNSYGRGGGAPEAAGLGSLIRPPFAMTNRLIHRWIVTGGGGARNDRGRSSSSNLRNSMIPFRFPQRWGKGPAHITRITPSADASGTAGDLTGVHPAMVHTQGFHATTTPHHTHDDHNNQG